MYKAKGTRESKRDVRGLVAYMSVSLKNYQAAQNFLKMYHKQVQNLLIFPYGYRETGISYQGHEIRIKSFSTYNIFYVINERTRQIIILRVLKNRQNWKTTLQDEDSYSF